MGLKTKVFIIFVIISISLMSLAVYSKNINRDKNIPVVQGTFDLSSYPVIQNIPPNEAIVGSKYVFNVGIMDQDTHPANYVVKIVDAPSWINVEGTTVFGIPEANHLGTNKVEIEISDGEHSTFSTFYVIVILPNEN